MKTALIVVDVQVDFVEGGSLPVTGGSNVARRIAELVKGQNEVENPFYSEIVFTKDWHTAGSDNGGHMSDNPDYVDTWPFHCVANTKGAQFADPLASVVADMVEPMIFFKGMNKPAYSGFEGMAEDIGLDEYLVSRGITDVHVVGLAADYCVKATAMDAIEEGFTTRIVTPMTAGINASPAEVAEEVMKAQQ